MNAANLKYAPGRNLALTGSIMQLALVAGVVATVVGLMQAVTKLGREVMSSTPDPGAVSAAVGEAIIPTVVGGVIALVGAILMTVALLTKRYRARWFFWVLMFDGSMLVTVLPPVGLFFLIYSLVKQKEFLHCSHKESGKRRETVES